MVSKLTLLYLRNRISITSYLIVISALLICVVSSAREPPMVRLPEQGMLKGTYLKMFRTQLIIGYLGIPYAQPPTDERRFQPPDIGLPSWEGVRNASMLPAECLQNPLRPRRKHEEAFASLVSKSYGLTTNTGDDPAAERHYSEDCLFLNIYLPDGTSWYSIRPREIIVFYLYLYLQCQRIIMLT